MSSKPHVVPILAGCAVLLSCIIGHKLDWLKLKECPISHEPSVPLRDTLPYDLHSWRTTCEKKTYIAVWNIVAQTLLKREGFKLWSHRDEVNQGIKEAPRPSNYTFLSASRPTALIILCSWCNNNGLTHAIRSEDDKDYVVRIITAAGDGHTHLRIIKRLSSSPDILLSNNHILPIVREIEYGDLTFVVFPKIAKTLLGAFSWAFHNSTEDIIYMLMQALEAIVYIHRNLIAHRDLFLDNFLVEWFPESMNGRLSVLRPRVYLIDFETAVDFPADSLPSSRLSTGIPIPEDLPYGRDRPPELTRNEPYCPFRLDIWQFGFQVIEFFPHSGIPEIDAIWPPLVASEPQDRPTAQEVLDQLDAIIRSTPPSAFHIAIEEVEFV